MRLAEKLKWHVNRWVCQHPALLDRAGATLTVIDMFRSPGDTLLTGMACRIIKRRFPNIRINCQVEHPELLRLDPAIDALNEPAGTWRVHFEYLALLEKKDPITNVLAPVMGKLGIRQYAYRNKVYLSDGELGKARGLLGSLDRPVISINVMSRESVKVWRLEYWRTLIQELSKTFAIVQLGDKREPFFPDVISFAGKLSMRESMAVLALARAHIGPDSFLMHAANGLDVPSVIIFGGSRTPASFGYPENINLHAEVPCGPCYIQDSLGGTCPKNTFCMEMIAPDLVRRSLFEILNRKNPG